ncbi:MAG: hypothetical protein JXR46_15790 [Calditrichaceae bacterium]|nr:hypothetical protein [Calditrichaceae bacterium]MBN2710506.1 hypothetical protein [Calditrichaceae bacterium]RQV97298.1 MAG: hypothetical protein EH224_01775 [Calditrichota bacterium]
MSKKYVYLKTASYLSNSTANGKLPFLEISSFIPDIQVISNVLQLYQIDDLKLLISKSTSFQKLLTGNLPRNGDHGFLWQGEYLPDLDYLLKKSGIITTCIIIQKNTESLPEIMKTGFSRLCQKTEIYNWQIFVLPAYRKIYRFLFSQNGQFESEIEIDRICREFWRGFEQTEESIDLFEPDEHEICNHNENDWKGPLINVIADPKNGYLLIPAPGDELLFKEAVSSGISVLGVKDDEFEKLLLEDFFTLYHFNPAHYNKAISNMISQIRMLQAGNATSQKDLFTDAAEQKFLVFWEMEKERYKTLNMKWILVEVFKLITIARFLIRNNLISSDAEINRFIQAALIRWTEQSLKKKRIADPAADFIQYVRNIYLKYYLLAKIKEIAPKKPDDPGRLLGKLDDKQEQGNLNITSVIIEQNNNALLLKETEKLHDIFIQDPDQYPENDICAKIDLTDYTDEELTVQIRNQDGVYLFLGNYGKTILTRLMAGLHYTEAAYCLRRWISIVDQLVQFSKVISNPGKMAIIINPITIRNHYGHEEINIKKVIDEILQTREDQISYRIMHEIKINHTDKPNHNNKKIILILNDNETAFDVS